MNCVSAPALHASQTPVSTAGTLHLHVLTAGLTADDVAYFNAKAEDDAPTDDLRYNSVAARIARVPHIAIGQVSWSEALRTGDDTKTVPPTVYETWRAVGEETAPLTDELIAQIMAAFQLDNPTIYTLGEIGEIADFLLRYRGHEVFTVTW